jgi:hypothetical protein
MAPVTQSHFETRVYQSETTGVVDAVDAAGASKRPHHATPSLDVPNVPRRPRGQHAECYRGTLRDASARGSCRDATADAAGRSAPGHPTHDAPGRSAAASCPGERGVGRR